MSEERIVEGVRLSNPDKILYPEQGITKAEVVEATAEVVERKRREDPDAPVEGRG